MTSLKCGSETSANNYQPKPLNIQKGAKSSNTSRRKPDISQNV